MANDSGVDPKMLFAILTDKEIEELKERASRQKNFYAAKLLRWEADEQPEPMANPVQVAVCVLQRRPRHAGWSLDPRTVRTRPVGATTVRRGKRLTLFRRDDIAAA